MSIEVREVTKIYDEQKAVDNISFSIGSGEVVGFLGPNGAGKSTTMKIITGYIPPTEGTALVCGMDIHDDLDKVKKEIGYLPESNPLYYEMYVREYLEFVAKLHGFKGNLRERVKEMIDITGLEVEQKKKIGQLSKGYKQRVGLAQAMIHDPKVLILDEPTSGLDPNQLAEIRKLISKLGEEKTVMLSTHIMQEVEALCDRVIIINKGRIEADDKPENLRKANKGEFIIVVEFKDDLDETELQNIDGVESVSKTTDRKFKLVGSRDNREEIFRFAAEKGKVILDMQLMENTLETVFREITTREKKEE